MNISYTPTKISHFSHSTPALKPLQDPESHKFLSTEYQLECCSFWGHICWPFNLVSFNLIKRKWLVPHRQCYQQTLAHSLRKDFSRNTHMEVRETWSFSLSELPLMTLTVILKNVPQKKRSVHKNYNCCWLSYLIFLC
jgi:hypothetical protein